MSSELAISVRDVSKIYRAYEHPLQGLVSRLTAGRIGHAKEFHALNSVDFDIAKGEAVGVIGRNGSGKSTLLQIICGIRKPTTGTVRTQGRISALLELGSGFHPEFTGRENVYMQGAIVGITRMEMEARFGDIAAFADIGEYLDQPVKTYSSGMFVRLAFAVVVAIAPDILIIDEALAVGDAAFQLKCFRKIEALREEGVTIVFVSHSTEQVARLCDTAILLDRGKLICRGEPNSVIREYLPRLFEDAMRPATPDGGSKLEGFEGSSDPEAEKFHLRPGYNSAEHRWGTREARIVDFRLSTSGDVHVCAMRSQERLKIDLKVLFLRTVDFPIYGLVLKSKEGITLFGTTSRDIDLPFSARPHVQAAGSIARVRFELTPQLCAGDYFLSLGVVDGSRDNLIPLDRRYESIQIRVTDPPAYVGMVNMEPDFTYIENNSGFDPLAIPASGGQVTK
jgi:lipopolysaccharide transport system ATP-binding protein